MDIAAGEYGYTSWYFRSMLEAGAVDVLQVDATRCAGITGFLQADALCAARSLPLSAHTAPSIHAHACGAAQQAIHSEYFFDHVRVEKMAFDGAIEALSGMLRPDPTRPGFGLTWKTADMVRFQSYGAKR
jgi:L-alanine-DL-glutamate epimerase-like enolase superfamily enzyme